ncbi:MAG: hypothetical protein CMM48_10350 [Rhodospirillaceae bacterium]|nr:hypothetical protein [Rhodospirillaceae bacterium]
MTIAYWLLLAVALQRLAELIYSNRNTKRLVSEGGSEVGKGHYSIIVAVHVGWLVTMTLANPPDTNVIWPLVALYGAVQLLRIWVLVSLGRYWSTRVIDLPDAPLVRHGPYRWCKHPNYVVVVLEVAILPLAFQLWAVAAIFTFLNSAILAKRIHVENQVLRHRG